MSARVKRSATASMLLGVLGTAAVGTVPLAAAAPPATAPADEQAEMARWISQLANPDATQREAAVVALMGLHRDDLPALRQLVATTALQPAQAAPLHEIVVHVYLSGEPYEHDRDHDGASAGFLGLLGDNSDMFSDGDRLGVLVPEGIPGFPSFRMLRTGDMIVAVVLRPNARPHYELPTPNFRALRDAVEQAGADRTVGLLVLRQGQRMELTLQLSARPALDSHQRDEPEVFFNTRRQKGEAYWHNTFLPLLRPGMS